MLDEDLAFRLEEEVESKERPMTREGQRQCPSCRYLLRRYGIKPFRYRGQRYTTVMARVPSRFVNETLWPEFTEVSKTLRDYLSEVTERIVSQVICQDNSEADIAWPLPLVIQPLKNAEVCTLLTRSLVIGWNRCKCRSKNTNLVSHHTQNRPYLAGE